MIDKSRRSFLGKVAMLGAGAGFLVKFEGATPAEVRKSMSRILKDTKPPKLDEIPVELPDGLPGGPLKIRGVLKVHKPLILDSDIPDPSFIHLGKQITVKDYQAVHDQLFKNKSTNVSTNISMTMLQRGLAIESVYARGNLLLWRIISKTQNAAGFEKNRNDDNSLWVAATVPSSDQRAIHHTNIVDKGELIKFTSLYGD